MGAGMSTGESDETMKWEAKPVGWDNERFSRRCWATITPNYIEMLQAREIIAV